MSDRAELNERFLRNIYRKGAFQGHAFCCAPPVEPIYSLPDGDYTLSNKPIENWVPWVAENYRRQVDLLEAVGDDSVPCARLSTGTHLFAAAFGCEVRQSNDNNPFALPFVKSVERADAIEAPDLWKSPPLQRVFELGRAVQKELGKDVYLGPCDLQSGFDTACLIWEKQELFAAMLDERGQASVRRLAAECARLLKNFLVALREEFPRLSPCHCPSVWAPPEMGPWLSNDECGAIGVEHFREFLLPELVDLSETFGGLGMHCCASAEHQFEAFKEIPNFYAFNRVPAKKGWRPILEHFGGPQAPVHALAWIEEKDIEYLIAHAPDGTRFIFELCDAQPDQARAWLERMRRMSARTD
ncbi:MAG: hypothetical protein NTX50_09400 [Candidatus Sumerlaeota bacterium]|nr:hypothetical protein [Candidatus Sumerlaeota bacterium]